MTIRRGVTLLEMIVAIALLAIVSGVTSVSFARLGVRRTTSAAESTTAAKRRAIAEGRAITVVTLDERGAKQLVTALPDGRLIMGRGWLSPAPSERHAEP